MSTRTFAISTLVALFATTAAMPLALAIPGGGSNANDNMMVHKPVVKKKSPKALKCKRSETAKTVKRHGKFVRLCIKLKADVLPDTELYQNARMLADDGEYEWALDHLRLMSDQNDPEVLNYTGYSNRKAGRLETGISYYHKALARDPNYVQAREYLGEAYVLAGRIDLARAQLQEIEQRCGATCEAFVALDTAIKAPAI